MLILINAKADQQTNSFTINCHKFYTHIHIISPSKFPCSGIIPLFFIYHEQSRLSANVSFYFSSVFGCVCPPHQITAKDDKQTNAEGTTEEQATTDEKPVEERTEGEKRMSK